MDEFCSIKRLRVASSSGVVSTAQRETSRGTSRGLKEKLGAAALDSIVNKPSGLDLSCRRMGSPPQSPLQAPFKGVSLKGGWAKGGSP